MQHPRPPLWSKMESQRCVVGRRWLKRKHWHSWTVSCAFRPSSFRCREQQSFDTPVTHSYEYALAPTIARRSTKDSYVFQGTDGRRERSGRSNCLCSRYRDDLYFSGGPTPPPSAASQSFSQLLMEERNQASFDAHRTDWGGRISTSSDRNTSCNAPIV